MCYLFRLFLATPPGPFYKKQDTGRFTYTLSKIIPMPAARVDGRLVPYENYLFHIRHTLHYKRTQENLDFNTKEGQDQYKGIQKLTLDKVIKDEYIRILAKNAGLRVERSEVDAVVNNLKGQQQIADNNTFEGVLKSFYDWSEADLRRVIGQQLLTQKLLSSIETDKNRLANDTLASLDRERTLPKQPKKSPKTVQQAPAGEQLRPRFLELAGTIAPSF